MATIDLLARGDRDLAEQLLAAPEVRRAIEYLERHDADQGARRQLLATATRLTAEMAPDLHAIVDRARTTLGVGAPIEIYVYPESTFNAAAVRPERGRLLLVCSSALLEAFAPGELAFVAGHEVGHWLFDHHRIPAAHLLGGGVITDPSLALRLFSWQRYAEISADRTGVLAAGTLEAAARALFKLASGLSGDRVQVRIDQFLAQVGDLREEVERDPALSGPRQDWFATHPFSPLRLKAAELFAGSEAFASGGGSRERLEAEVDELMTLMDPSYLLDRSDSAEAMRRLLVAGGIAVATAAGEASEAALAALERLLGPGALPPGIDPPALRADLPSRIEAVNRIVPPLRRAQVIRDLCVIARADDQVDEVEVKVIREIAAAVGVDPSLVTCAIDPRSGSCATSPRA